MIVTTLLIYADPSKDDACVMDNVVLIREFCPLFIYLKLDPNKQEYSFDEIFLILSFFLILYYAILEMIQW